MDISQIDKNFKVSHIGEKNVKWFKATDAPIALYGGLYDENRGEFARMPHDVAAQVSPSVEYLARNTAGLRVRFVTDSPYVAIKANHPDVGFAHHMTIALQYGFSLYVNGNFRSILCPLYDDIRDIRCYDLIEYLPAGKKEIELCFPLYGGVSDLFIGIADDSTAERANGYTYAKPVVFYGSSITQGGCATRPGNDYESMLSHWLDTDFINLGFSGAAKGEKTIAEYIASLDASVFVLDYDHNAPSAEHLMATHRPLYETIRAAHPATPIILISKPDFDSAPSYNAPRRDVVYDTYAFAKRNGDKMVAFIDGETLFGDFARDCCTVDGCHPNDLGFYRMAKTILPQLQKFLRDSRLA